MSGPSSRLRRVRGLTLLIVFAAALRAAVGSEPAMPDSGTRFAPTRELAAAAQDEDLPNRSRRKSPPTAEEAREQTQARKLALLEDLRKEFPNLKTDSSPAGVPSQGGAAGNRRTPPGHESLTY